MNNENTKKLAALFANFKKTESYTKRVENTRIVPVLRDIIIETLKNDPITNQQLTGFIQMFKVDCTANTFDRYLEINIPDTEIRNEISERAYAIDLNGYTGAGLNSVTRLNSRQLKKIREFLLKAINDVKTVEQAVQLCIQFDSENIPFVKSGVYSPWLHYINPELFPIVNNSHEFFLKWIGAGSDYPSCISDFQTIKGIVGEADLGIIDLFAYDFKYYFDTHQSKVTLDIAGKQIYKMSHGYFKKTKLWDTGIVEILEKKNWISLNIYTGKGQAIEFQKTATIGDYVYVCYGGDDLFCIGKIISESQHFDEETDALISGDDEWVYRAIEPLFYPQISSIRELKSKRRFFMPSGNSTFYKLPKNELEYLNKVIFEPKFGVEIVDSSLKNRATETETDGTSEGNHEIVRPILNQILYGPPGTGKTYSTIDKAIEILEGRTDIDRMELKDLFSGHQRNGRVFFTTFHQSMAYEDFIEGIKPVLTEGDDEKLRYKIEDGLFMCACVEATYNYITKNYPLDITNEIASFNQLFDTLVDEVSSGVRAKLETIGGEVSVEVTSNGNLGITHLGGTRMYTVSRARMAALYEVYKNPEEIDSIVVSFRQVIGGCNATAYWAVLNAIAEIRDQERDVSSSINHTDNELSYEEKKQVVQNHLTDAPIVLRDEDQSEPFVFIIDEINRGNVAQILGELITLIEDDKRIGEKECLTITLPYSKTSFSVPPNLYIIGTMNTADRSVEALDTALRRRFTFVPMLPDETKLKPTSDGIDLPQMLKTLNSRLKILKDADHTIGHAWLMNVNDTDGLIKAFANKILPLLQEYFYNDYEKLGMLLGEKFFKTPITVDDKSFAKFFGSSLSSQYENAEQYQLEDVDKLTKDVFVSIYQ